jgi:hypothetical protein
MNHKGPQLGEASLRRPLRGGAFSLPVHKKRPQNFDGVHLPRGAEILCLRENGYPAGLGT